MERESSTDPSAGGGTGGVRAWSRARRSPTHRPIAAGALVVGLLVLLSAGFAGPAAAATGSDPTVTGGFPPVIGATLTATPGMAGDSIVWETCDANGQQVGSSYLPADSATMYTLAPSDAGTYVCAVEQGLLGLTDGSSDPVGPVGSGPTLSSAGEPVTEGQPLSVTQGAWGAGATDITDTWFDCPAGGGACTKVMSGTVGSSYTVARSDVGSTIAVQETATAPDGTQGLTQTTATGVVAATAPTEMTPSTIIGTPRVGDTLTASTGTWTNDPTSYAYQWERCSAGMCTTIANATSTTYIPVAADVGSVLEVDVTGVVDGVAGSPYPSYPTSAVAGDGGVAPIAPTAPTAPTAKGRRTTTALGRLTATMRWTFRYTPRYTQIIAFGVEDAAVGSTLTTRCSGRGCPFKIHHDKVRALQRCHAQTTRVCLAPRTIDLERQFRGHDLGVGARVAVTISRDRYVGKYYRFIVRPRRPPRVSISCLAPGSSKPGRACTAP